MNYLEAKSVAAFTNALEALDHETRATITATEAGEPWATVTVSPMTNTRRSVFPNYLDTTTRGDTRKRGQSGVHYVAGSAESRHALVTVIERARRMRA